MPLLPILVPLLRPKKDDERNCDVGQLSRADVPSEPMSRRLQLAITWTRQRELVCRSLSVTTTAHRSRKVWLDFRPNTDGERYIDLGSFPVGGVGIHLHLEAADVLHRCAVFLIQDERIVKELRRAEGRRSGPIARGEQWRDAWIYAVN